MFDYVKMRPVEEHVISKAIINNALRLLDDIIQSDVVIVGAGPAGMTAAVYLARRGIKTLVVERRLSFGGGIGGGGILLPAIVVEEPANKILDDVGCKYEVYDEGVYVVSPAELIAKLASSAIDAGAKFILGVHVEDVVYREEEDKVKICGVVVQWTAIKLAQLHVDPIGIKSRVVVDATGHDAEVLRIVQKKIPKVRMRIPGESSMWASLGERLVVEYTGKVCEGLYVAGMAVATLHGLPRMGPIFGGMLLSGAKVAEEIAKELS